MIAMLSVAFGHPLAPAALEIDVLGTGSPAVAELRFRTPTARPAGVRLQPRLDGPCDVALHAPVVADGWLVSRRTWTCEDLATLDVVVDGLERAPVDVVLTVRERDHQTRRLLTSDRPRVPLLEPAAPWTAFFGLGVTHLIEGLDHVLLVVGLALLLGPTRRLVVALTSFTVGHSVTLGLVAATGGGPAAWIEVAIAASLVWLALELVAEDVRRAPTLPGFLVRHPGALCGAIGLLHGAGFGGALSDLGLPRQDVVGALLLFNLGIEAGQLAVVAAVALVAWMVPGLRRVGRLPPAYLIGTLAVAWTLTRLWGAL